MCGKEGGSNISDIDCFIYVMCMDHNVQFHTGATKLMVYFFNRHKYLNADAIFIVELQFEVCVWEVLSS